MSSKIYFRHLFEACAEALHTILNENRHADKVIESYFKSNKKWGKRDRHFFAETVYDCVRWKGRWMAQLHIDDLSHKSNIHKMMALCLLESQKPLPDWYSSWTEELQQKIASTQLRPWELQSVPKWLYDQGAQELGEDLWLKTLNSLNQQAPVVLRVNRIKYTKEEFFRACQKEQIPYESTIIPSAPDAVILSTRRSIFSTQLFQNGGCEMQDASSQQVAPFLNPQPSERIVDACAGAGGKSLHLASLMQNKGKIIALDIHEWKLQELQKRARRAGAHCIETRSISSSKVIKRLNESMDAALLDVPCSGLGVLKRNPDTKWKLTSQRLDELQALQQELLQNYSRMVRRGGRLVYSTCSILPSENQLQVQKFLQTNSDWIFVKEKVLLPQEQGFDGFYMALLSRQ